MTAPEWNSRIRTIALFCAAVAANATGLICLSYGMKSLDLPPLWNFESIAWFVGTALTSPAVLVGLPFLILFFLSFLLLLSRADLSFVLPMMSSCFVVNSVLAWLVLAEQISLERWAGIILVSTGVVLVGRTGKRL